MKQNKYNRNKTRNQPPPWRAPRYWQQAAPRAPQNITLNSWGPPSAPASRWYPQMSCRVSSQQRWSGLGLGCGVAERKGKKRRNPVKFWVRALSWEPALHPSVFSPRWCHDRLPVGEWPSCLPLSRSSTVVQSEQRWAGGPPVAKPIYLAEDGWVCQASHPIWAAADLALCFRLSAPLFGTSPSPDWWGPEFLGLPGSTCTA